MKFHEFVESTYVSTNLSLQKDFTVWKQSKTTALQKLLQAQRWLYTALHYPLLLANYVLVLLGLTKRPPEAKELIAEMQARANLKAKTEEKLKILDQPTPISTQPVA